MSDSSHQETRLAFVRKPDLKVLGKVNQNGTDCAGICKFYEGCSKENTWGTLNSIPELITGTRGYYFGKLDGPAHCEQHMVAIEVPADFNRVPEGMTITQVPGAVYAVFVNPQGNGAPWGEADGWSKTTKDWIVLSEKAPWSEDDGPKGCSLMFVPVKPACGNVMGSCTILEYPLSNEEIAASAVAMEDG